MLHNPRGAARATEAPTALGLRGPQHFPKLKAPEGHSITQCSGPRGIQQHPSGAARATETPTALGLRRSQHHPQLKVLEGHSTTQCSGPRGIQQHPSGAARATAPPTVPGLRGPQKHPLLWRPQHHPKLWGPKGRSTTHSSGDLRATAQPTALREGYNTTHCPGTRGTQRLPLPLHHQGRNVSSSPGSLPVGCPTPITITGVEPSLVHCVSLQPGIGQCLSVAPLQGRSSFTRARPSASPMSGVRVTGHS
ncbi:hypothetical protein NDU88_007456 [Pleurodeles waltl]|uniref:Uncharacterized protein n=1 Tax=Pleurodeles waltl TaxID=8319 RepID=A0AAV7QKV4_PLEWA|nr:hypothetical protein NDU88_007456 [Pleurodeles waltl]